MDKYNIHTKLRNSQLNSSITISSLDGYNSIALSGQLAAHEIDLHIGKNSC